VPLPDRVVRSRRVVVNDGTRAAALHIQRGKIVGVLDFDDVPRGCPLDDAGDRIVMPGIVDAHVHVSAHGRTDAESFEAATRAAAAGGVTTIIDTSLNSIPALTTGPELEKKRRAAERACFVDIGFWGGVVPGNASELRALAAAGAFGFVCALARPGVGECRAVSEADLRLAMPVIAQLGAPLLAHAELPTPVEAIRPGEEQAAAGHRSILRRVLSLATSARTSRRYSTYLASRPKESENQAVALLIQLCRQYRTRTHIVQLSSSDALTPIFHARSERLPLTASTCPHYLHFVADDVPDGATEFTCAPPIRDRQNREFLWAALAGGLIQMVVSDHSPALPAVKRSGSGNFLRAPGGISSLPFSLPAMWTAAVPRQYSVAQLANWMCRTPAQLLGLKRKGAIEVGYDADLVIWDPEAEFTVDPAALEQRDAVTPYVGRNLRGVIERTYLGGSCIYERGVPMPPARGRLLTPRSRSSL
jgi:allantoinase